MHEKVKKKQQTNKQTDKISIYQGSNHGLHISYSVFNQLLSYCYLGCLVEVIYALNSQIPAYSVDSLIFYGKYRTFSKSVLH